MADPVKSRVDSAAWPASAAPVAGPARRRPGLRAAIGRALALCLVSAALYFWLGWVRIAAALAAAGAAMIVLAAAWPGGYAAMDRFARAFGRGIGQVMTWALLAPLYWTFFAAIGNLARLRGKDPLSRKFEPGAGTYWIARARDAKAKDYMRQF